jgi:hypothetical protein
MSKGTLEPFLGIPAQPGKRYSWPDEERCEKCGKIIKGAKYELTEKGKKKKYCQECAKKILRPQENIEAPI